MQFCYSENIKKILIILHISCLCLNTISCSTKSNDKTKGFLYNRESFGKWGWYKDGNLEKDGIYEGEIRKGKPDGLGTYTHYSAPKSSTLVLPIMAQGWVNSLVFALFIWEMLHQGKPKIKDAKYVGAWKRGEKHGHGKYHFPNGDTYIGEWRRGKKHGEGLYLFSDGDRYDGNWKKGEKHGQGTYTFSDGDIFVGKWKEGKVHGKGTYTYPDGSKLIGKWKNGKKDIEGKLILSD